jgi:hypothetical protein
MKSTITFDEGAKAWVIKTLGLKKDRAGLIVDQHGVLMRGLDGHPVKMADFAGIVKVRGEMRIIAHGLIDLVVLSDVLDELPGSA